MTTFSIAVTGATGLIGRRLCAVLESGGHSVRRIVRAQPKRQPKPTDIEWDPQRGTIDAAALAGVDAIVNLAGEPIASRWTEAKRRRILESRVRGTALIAATMASMPRKPTVLVSASAIGFYGDRGADEVDESSPRGTGFVADVCTQWEAAAQPARDAGIRVVHPRIGLVLAADGGALQRLRTPFALGLGGPVGNGRQGVSWISIDDLVASLLFAIVTPALAGVYNAVAPAPVTNREFANTLGRVLRRPAIVPLPAFAVKLLFGAMGEELLLAGATVRPRRLEQLGFRFEHATLESALRRELRR